MLKQKQQPLLRLYKKHRTKRDNNPEGQERRSCNILPMKKDDRQRKSEERRASNLFGDIMPGGEEWLIKRISAEEGATSSVGKLRLGKGIELASEMIGLDFEASREDSGYVGLAKVRREFDDTRWLGRSSAIIGGWEEVRRSDRIPAIVDGLTVVEKNSSNGGQIGKILTVVDEQAEVRRWSGRTPAVVGGNVAEMMMLWWISGFTLRDRIENLAIIDKTMEKKDLCSRSHVVE
ncbi:hypothetical protein M5K25_008232 [Dendrobium thyrsiflorum]|uniref:Uncharacterized protein n=1 Tax=Dendrobium thyrsiflorum TaxID=117978 RepID=A0ABD0V7H6_DENTH